MAQTNIIQTGAFTEDSKNAINSNFSELYANSIPSTEITSATYTVTSAVSGAILNLRRAAGITVTLPAATGTGNSYVFVIGTTITSNTTIIRVANSTDVMGGVATMGSAGGTSLSTGTTATSDTITFNGTTSAGIIGTRVEARDVQAGLWQVEVHGVASGVAVTPFSATV